ncbi:hypothetical protein [Pseudoxanthomonas mexicana]
MADETKPSEPNLAWQERLRIYSRDDAFAKEIMAAWKHVEALRIALAQEISAFIDRAMSERRTTRQEIVRRHQAINGRRSKVETSHRILMLREEFGRLELVWREIWRPKWDGRGTAPDPRYNYVPCNSKAGTHMAQVKKGAHVDEIELLVEHEREARRYRHLWSKTSKVAIALRHLGEAKLRLLEFAEPIDDED